MGSFAPSFLHPGSTVLGLGITVHELGKAVSLPAAEPAP
jgi:hypothetical protein